MAYSYLQSFRSALPTAQGNQILKLLISKRDSGEIRTIDEFKEKLKTLTAVLLSSQVTATFKAIKAIANEDTSSEQFNYMLDTIQNDLESAFAEANNLDEIIEAHHNIIEAVGLKTLRYSLAELEEKVGKYEFIASSSSGYDDALYNTFRGSNIASTRRSDTAAGIVFIDPRSNQSIPSYQDCQEDYVGERLLLGSDKKKEIKIQAVSWLSNEQSIRGEIDATFKDSSLSNLVDGAKNTYWVVPILVSQVRKAGVPLELGLSLGSYQDVNYVEIELACKYPLTFLGVDYLDSTGARQNAVTSNLTMKGDTRVNFKRTNTNFLILRFRQDNYEEIQFQNRTGENNFYRALLNEPQETIDLSSVSKELKDVLTSSFLLEDIYNLTEDSLEQQKYFEYVIGFDNIRAGLDVYNSIGIFSSIAKEIATPGQVALKVVETRPYQNTGSTTITPDSFTYPARTTSEDSKFYHGSIEYWLLTQAYAEGGNLVSTDLLPLFPVNAQRVYHEQLIFKEASSGSLYPNMGQLMFYTLAANTGASSDDLVIYRNGTALTYSTSPGIGDWEYIAPGDSSGLTQIVPGNGTGPMKRGIKILARTNSSDIYTASYTPTLSNTKLEADNSGLLRTIDLTGDLFARLTEGNIIVFNPTRYSQSIASINCYLIILMRRNSAEDNFTPTVEEYLLATGTRNSEKFIGV